MAVRKRRRIRSPHPGVVSLKRVLPSGSIAWQARYQDPDTGKRRKPLLDAVALPTEDSRKLWAVRLSKTLAKRRMDLQAGAAIIDARPLDEALKAYRSNAAKRLKDKTLTTYELAVSQFLHYAERAAPLS